MLSMDKLNAVDPVDVSGKIRDYHFPNVIVRFMNEHKNAYIFDVIARRIDSTATISKQFDCSDCFEDDIGGEEMDKFFSRVADCDDSIWNF